MKYQVTVEVSFPVEATSQGEALAKAKDALALDMGIATDALIVDISPE